MPETNRSLVTTGVTVRYGGVTAVNDVSITVEPGQIVGLIGPNGAGKTSFVDAVTGFARASGEIRLGGKRIDGLAPHRRRHAGLSRTWQSGELFNNLSVAQNVLVSARPPGWSTIWSDIFGRRRTNDTMVQAILERVGIADLADVPAGSLSLGQQKLVGVARALAGDATTLLLDEPAAGLDSRESRVFAGHIRALVDEGYGALLIDHDMELVLDVCDKIYVLEFGQIIFAGSPELTRNDPRVIAAYLGSPGELTHD